jgi:DNA-directed RNA polymerase sigma subunit (sigma70/sigma32)
LSLARQRWRPRQAAPIGPRRGEIPPCPSVNPAKGGPVDAGLRQYLETIRRFPVLSREEESRLARLVREEGDRAAADTLITSHLRLVGKVAMRYRG